MRLKWFFTVDSGLELISVDLCRSAISIQLNAIKMTRIEMTLLLISIIHFDGNCLKWLRQTGTMCCSLEPMRSGSSSENLASTEFLGSFRGKSNEKKVSDYRSHLRDR